jgi:hypothetical protein
MNPRERALLALTLVGFVVPHLPGRRTGRWTGHYAARECGDFTSAEWAHVASWHPLDSLSRDFVELLRPSQE